MMITKTEAYRYALCMELQQDKFSYSIIDIETKQSVIQKDITLLLFNKDELINILKDDLFSYDYKTMSLVVASERQTLVPNAIFTGANPKDIFELNHQTPIDNLDYNRIAELSIVSIYEIPLWIKSAFVIKMPRVKIIHTSTVLLKGIFKRPVFSPKVHIYWQSNSFYIIITSKGKLQYFNLFKTNEIANLVYHLLFTLEQKELDIKTMAISMYGVPSNWSKLDEVSKLLNHKVEVDQKNQNAEHFIFSNQLLCV